MKKVTASPSFDDGTASMPVGVATQVPVPTNQTPGWLTIDEAAALIRVRKSWMYERTRTNTVPHVKLGKYLRFDRDELIAWIGQFHRDGRGRGPRSFGGRDTQRKNHKTALGLKAHRS